MRDQANQVHHILKQRILDGVSRPSESLTEVTLAAELGVSRNTVRKALLKLESENLVVIEENKRARVRAFAVEEVMQYLEVRELLEGFVIRQGVPFMGNAELGEMRTILSQMRKCLKTHDLLGYSQLNWRFHDVVYRICPNAPAVELVMAIKNQLKRYNIKTILIQGRGEDSFEEHRKILAACERHDADIAERRMRQHIANLRTVLEKHFALLL